MYADVSGKLLPPSLRMKSEFSKQEARHPLFCLQSDPEDDNKIFLRNIRMLLVPEDNNLHTHSSENLVQGNETSFGILLHIIYRPA
jgi:hypothetical protein